MVGAIWFWFWCSLGVGCVLVLVVCYGVPSSLGFVFICCVLCVVRAVWVGGRGLVVWLVAGCFVGSVVMDSACLRFFDLVALVGLVAIDFGVRWVWGVV